MRTPLKTLAASVAPIAPGWRTFIEQPPCWWPLRDQHCDFREVSAAFPFYPNDARQQRALQL